MTKIRTILGTSLGQFVLTKETTLPAILKKCEGKDVLKLETVADGWDISKTEFNLKEVKVLGLYNVARVPTASEEMVEMGKEAKA